MRQKRVLMALAIFFIGASMGVAATPAIKILINGKGFSDVKLINGQPYVHLGKVAQSLGAEIKLDSSKKTYTIKNKPTPTPKIEYIHQPPQIIYVTPVPTPTPTPSLDTVVSTNITLFQGPMKMLIKSITLTPNYKAYESDSSPERAIVFDVEIENTSDQKISWSRWGWIVTLNTKEQIDSSSSDFNSEWMAGIIRKGKVIFPTTSDLKDIKSLSLILNQPRNDANDDLGEPEKKLDFVLN